MSKKESPSHAMGTHDLLASLSGATKRTINQEALRAQRFFSSLGEPVPSLRALEAIVLESYHAAADQFGTDDEDFDLYRWMYLGREQQSFVRLFFECLEALTEKFEERGLTPTSAILAVVKLALEDLEDLRGRKSPDVNRFENITLPLLMKRAAEVFPDLFADGNGILVK